MPLVAVRPGMVATRGMLPAIAIVCTALAIGAASADEFEVPELPSAAAMDAIASLPVTDVVRGEKTLDLSLPFRNLSPAVRDSFQTNISGNVPVPILDADSMLLQLEENVTAADIADLLQKYELLVTGTYPELGQIRVKVNLEPYLQLDGTGHARNEDLLGSLVELSKAFERDTRIAIAAPELLLRPQQEEDNAFSPTSVTVSSAGGERTDWGVVDIQADQLWQMPGAMDGTLFGVFDTGFGKHEDLIYSGLVAGTPVTDHGTHVAGIACGTHGNGIGVQGVIPNCHVRASAAQYYFTSVQGDMDRNAVANFSDIVASAIAFAQQQHELRSLNVSLGYNWKNYGINPDASDQANLRTIIEGQGRIAIMLLQWASANDVAVFSAAGNDSRGDGERVSVLYASPFNWAAITARRLGISNAGVVVEAHDQGHHLTNASNTGGLISCPGKDILSTIALDENHQPAQGMYGLLSGTSMASPYCAAGLTLLALVRPNYTTNERLF
jgi:subtilisin family serine protease